MKKIKLSQKQWEFIGKKAGWMRVAKDIPEITEYYEDTFPRIPKLDGYYLIKEHQKWGYCPTYKSKTDSNDILYFENGRLFRWEELKEYLKDVWRPSSREDQDWFVTNLN
jgi:hypothetical protein